MYLWNKKVFFLVLVPLALLLILYPSLVPGILAGRLGDTLHTLREGADDKLVNPLAADGPRLDKSAERRLKVWKAGVYMAKDRPLLGFGFGQFPRQIGRYAPELNQVDAHNTYLLVATEMGLPALLLFLLVLGIFARNAWFPRNFARRFFNFVLLVANRFNCTMVVAPVHHRKRNRAGPVLCCKLSNLPIRSSRLTGPLAQLMVLCDSIRAHKSVIFFPTVLPVCNSGWRRAVVSAASPAVLYCR